MTVEVCSLLVGKTADESPQICLNCAVRPCVLDSSKRYICSHCHGTLFFDKEDNEFRCLNCARSQVGQVVAKAPVPVPATLKRTVPYRPADVVHANGSWYPMGQIAFRPEHMIFLITNLAILQEGLYPRNPIGTGYTDSRIVIKRGKHSASFEHPVQLAAEVESRLEKCGQDGLLLEALYCWAKRPEYLMNAFKLSEWQLEKRIASTLRYISGWERRQQSYRDFRTKRKYERSKPQQPAPPSKTTDSLLTRLKRTLVKF